jgi:hypothetical protein
MGQILQPDVIQKPIQSGASQIVTFPGTNVITIGGQQFVLNNPSLNINNSGIGGLDAAVATFSMYNIFAVVTGGVAGIIGSQAPAPAGFTAYKKIGEFFVSTASNVVYQYGLDAPAGAALVSDSGSRTSGIINDTYVLFNCGVQLGTGLWQVYSYIQAGSTGGSSQINFFQSLFSDVDGANTGSLPPATIIETTALVGGSRSEVVGQQFTAPSDYWNSMGINHTIRLNVTSPLFIFQTPRMQCGVQANATLSGSIQGTRLGPTI